MYCGMNAKEGLPLVSRSDYLPVHFSLILSGDPLAGKERGRLTRTVEANGNTEEYSEISNPDQYLGKQKKHSKKSKHKELAPLNGPGLPPALEQHNPLSAGNIAL